MKLNCKVRGWFRRHSKHIGAAFGIIVSFIVCTIVVLANSTPQTSAPKANLPVTSVSNTQQPTKSTGTLAASTGTSTAAPSITPHPIPSNVPSPGTIKEDIRAFMVAFYTYRAGDTEAQRRDRVAKAIVPMVANQTAAIHLLQYLNFTVPDSGTKENNMILACHLLTKADVKLNKLDAYAVNGSPDTLNILVPVSITSVNSSNGASLAGFDVISATDWQFQPATKRWLLTRFTPGGRLNPWTSESIVSTLCSQQA